MEWTEAARLNLLAHQGQGESWASFAGRARISEKTIKAWCVGERRPSAKRLAFALKNLRGHQTAGTDTEGAGSTYPKSPQVGKSPTFPVTRAVSYPTTEATAMSGGLKHAIWNAVDEVKDEDRDALIAIFNYVARRGWEDVGRGLHRRARAPAGRKK